MDYATVANLAIAAAYLWSYWQLLRERVLQERHRRKLLAWSDSLQECNRATAALYEQLADRYPDDADIRKCRDIFAGKYAQH